jgi:multimeric flavodoxin WrbA
MKVCGIVGSPVKKGNVDLLVSQVLEGAQSRRATIDTVYLNDLKIKPCQDCVKDPDPEYCLFDDDMKVIYDILDSCDVIVLGSPLYFDTVSAQTKLMIDRCNCLMPYVKREDDTYGFERRKKSRSKGVFIAVGGQDRDFTPILTTVKAFFKWANIELVDKILYDQTDEVRGGVNDDEEAMARAFEIGLRIAAPADQKE